MGQFLLDNYIYIIIIVILVVVTVIGFLADKKKNQSIKNKNLENTNNMNNGVIESNNNTNMGTMIPNEGLYQQGPNNNLNFNNMNTTVNPVSSLNSNMQNNTNNNGMNRFNFEKTDTLNNNFNMSNGFTINSPISNPTNIIPVEPINGNTTMNAEPLYQPLQEQKIELPSMNVNPINMGSTVSQPIPMNNPNPVINNGMNNMINNNSFREAQNINQTPIAQPINQPINQPVGIINQTPSGVMQPAPPQPFVPQPLPNPNSQPVPSQIPSPPVQPMNNGTQGAVSFVYGGNGNNNLNM